VWDDFTFWGYENLLFPLLPLAFAWAALRYWRAPITVVAMFGDGGLMFYAASLGIGLALDALKDVELKTPRGTVGADNAMIFVGFGLAVLASVIFGMIALARADPSSTTSGRYDQRLLSTWSWQAGVLVAIFSTGLRAFNGLF